MYVQKKSSDCTSFTLFLLSCQKTASTTLKEWDKCCRIISVPTFWKYILPCHFFFYNYRLHAVVSCNTSNTTKLLLLCVFVCRCMHWGIFRERAEWKKVKKEVMHKVLTTYVCVGTLIGSGTGESDELMAPFVNHKTAH